MMEKHAMGEFKVGDLFEIIMPRDVPKAQDLTEMPDIAHPYAVINAQGTNQGIAGYASMGEDIQGAPSLTIGSRGTFRVFVQDKPVIIGNSAIGLRPKYKMSKNALLYLATAIDKLYSHFSGYTRYPTKTKLENENVITLPVTQTGEPDYEYMESYVKQIEVYLAVLGYSSLEDCELTRADRAILQDKPQMGEFKVGELFKIQPTKSYKLTNDALLCSTGKYPVVTNSETNNGITGRTNYKPTMPAGTITYSDTVTSNSIFYQADPFVGYSHVQSLTPLKPHEAWSKRQSLYFITTLRNATRGKYNYGTKFNRQKAAAEIISLPITSNGDPDYEYMENYIKAIEKLQVIKVKALLDKKLNLYKKKLHN